MSIPGTSRGIHYEFTEIQERHRILTDVSWVPTAFPIYKGNLDHGKLSHLMVSIGGGLCCSGRSSSFGPWDGMGTLLFWEVLMDDSHWFSPYLPIWRRDTVPCQQTPVKRQHHQLLHAYGEWSQHHFGIPAVSESNLCRHDTHMPQYTCTPYVIQYRRFTRRNQRKFDQNWILGSSILRNQVVGMQCKTKKSQKDTKKACMCFLMCFLFSHYIIPPFWEVQILPTNGIQGHPLSPQTWHPIQGPEMRLCWPKPCHLGDESSVHQTVTSSELTYPSEKGKSPSKVPLGGDMLVPWRVVSWKCCQILVG